MSFAHIDAWAARWKAIDAERESPAAKARDAEIEREMRERLLPRCEHCGAPAACHGSYEGAAPGYACDECCGHGQEDGRCMRLAGAR